MKLTPLLAATALIFSVSAYPSFAQSDSPYGDTAGSQAQSDSGMRGMSRMHDDEDTVGDRDSGQRGHRHHRDMGGGDHMGMMGMMMRPRGAHFRFRRGDARIDIQCPARESLQSCVEAATELIDRVSRLGPHTSTPGATNGSRGESPRGAPGAGGEGGPERAIPQRL
jgi:hypothetical protein